MREECVLVTGATGFIGGRVAEKLISQCHYKVVAIVRGEKNNKNLDGLKNKGIILIEGSFYDKELLKKTFEVFSIKFVIHCAAIRGSGKGKSELYHEVNVLGTRILLEASAEHGVRKFIFCSSVGVFGTVPKDLPAGLNTVLNGDNLYHNSKILAEKEVQKFVSLGLDAYIVRPAITYGKEDSGFPSTLVDLVKRRMLWLPSRDIKIQLLDVDALAGLFCNILKSDNRSNNVFIVADKTAISLKELADLIYDRFFNTPYPRMFRLPGFFFEVLLLFFRIAQNEKWAGRIMLISRSWYYDISDTVEALNFEPPETRENFVKSMGIGL